MQTVVPEEGVAVVGAVGVALPVEGAVVGVAGGVEGGAAVEVGGWVVVDVEHLSGRLVSK